jgi:hypothetical protein
VPTKKGIEETKAAEKNIAVTNIAGMKVAGMNAAMKETGAGGTRD